MARTTETTETEPAEATETTETVETTETPELDRLEETLRAAANRSLDADAAYHVAEVAYQAASAARDHAQTLYEDALRRVAKHKATLPPPPPSPPPWAPPVPSP